jgi:hypothetical protein
MTGKAEVNGARQGGSWSKNRQLMEKELVEAPGVEPGSENVTGQEPTCLVGVPAPGITLGRSRPALRTDKKRVPLA